MPDLRMVAYKSCHQIGALFRVQIKDSYARLAKPLNAAAECSTLSDHQGANTELPHQPAAVPARRQRSDHHYIAIRSQSACTPKRIRFRMRRRITFLYASIVSGANQLAPVVEHGSADGEAPFCEATAGFADCDRQHRSPILFYVHLSPHSENINATSKRQPRQAGARLIVVTYRPVT
jgi:hypothetical protein